MKHKNFFYSLFLTIATVIGASAAVGLSYAAYVYYQKFDSPLAMQTDKFTDYFSSGDGLSASTAYTITTPAHLRNLQKLTVLGVFTKNTYFQLGESFTWDDTPLYPIGTEDNPFNGQFDGRGYTITNLVVEGSHTNDIGMFGYVGINSRISNFMLHRPIINVNTLDNAEGKPSTNPLANLANDGDTLAITYTTSTKTFAINKSTVVYDGINYDVTYTSSNTDLMTVTKAGSTWSATTKVPTDTITGTDKYPVQLSAQIMAYFDNKLISHTVERWHINVNTDGTVNLETTEQNVGFWKTLHAANDEGLGPHGTYVGFFIGHLDGEASYLGMYGGTASGSGNGVINVYGRSVTSYSSLVGRTLNDNVNDDANPTYAVHGHDFHEQIAANIAGSVAIPTSSLTAVADPTVTGEVNNFFTNQKTYANNISTYLGMSATQRNYMRVFPTGGITTAVDTENKTWNAYSLSNPLAAYTKRQRRTWLFFSGNVSTDYSVKNGLWFFLSSETASQFFNIISTNEYDVTIRVRYIVPTTGNTLTEANKFQILYNNYDPDTPTIPVNQMQQAEWYNISGLSDTGFDANDYPVVQFNGSTPITNQVVETEINFQLTETAASLFTDKKLMFALGVGKDTSLFQNYLFGTNDNSFAKTYFNADPFSLSIVGLDVMFSQLGGNFSRQLNRVDYLSGTPTFNSGTNAWTSWNNESNVKVTFDVTRAVLSNEVASYSFYRRTDSGARPRVNVIYSVSANEWIPENTEGFKNATISGSVV